MLVNPCELLPLTKVYHDESIDILFVPIFPPETLHNNDVVITSKRRHFDVITSKLRRFDVITT